MKTYIVKPGGKVRLNEWNTDGKADFRGNKDDALKQLGKLNSKLSELQELLWAEHKNKVLVLLQAMDTAGKDGTIRSVFEGVNPQGVRVACFKQPTPEELDHDFLWRVHKQAPAKGEIVIFNRSHYEDVLVVRVRDLAPRKVWMQRFQHINDFEKMLADEGTTILKFYLHISKEEQKERLLKRLQDPDKNWKFSSGDLDDRKLWTKYIEAYEDALSRTSTKWAPWHIVPSNTKWFRDFVVSSVIIGALKGLKMKYPKAKSDLKEIKIE